jgi:outer membrane protein assembly factor BamB
VEQRHGTSAPPSTGSLPPPRLLVSSEEGTAALLDTRTGAVIWKVASHREVSTLAAGEQFFVAFGSRLRLISSPGQRRETTEEMHRRHEQIQAEPSWMEVRRTQDGSLLWRYADWNLIGRLTMQASTEVVVVSSTSMYGDQALHAFDRATGRRVWTYAGPGGHYHVQFGRCHVYGTGSASSVVDLDMLTGEPTTSPDTAHALPPYPDWKSSPSGQVILEEHETWHEDTSTNTISMRILDPTTGALLQERPLHGSVRALSDSGIAYCAEPMILDDAGITAVRLEDGAILWRADEVLPWQCAATNSALFSTRLAPPGIGYVYAHDAQTGQLLWHWHTPDSVRSLLALWGKRTPWLLADSVGRIGSTVATALAEPSRERANMLRRELREGQWRRPYGLDGAVNAMWLLASRDAVFLGTRLGVFALRAPDGKLLWHALPAVDVSFFPPTLS